MVRERMYKVKSPTEATLKTICNLDREFNLANFISLRARFGRDKNKKEH